MAESGQRPLQPVEQRIFYGAETYDTPTGGAQGVGHPTLERVAESAQKLAIAEMAENEDEHLRGWQIRSVRVVVEITAEATR